MQWFELVNVCIGFYWKSSNFFQGSLEKGFYGKSEGYFEKSENKSELDKCMALRFFSSPVLKFL